MKEATAKRFLESEFPPSVRGHLLPLLKNAAEVTSTLFNEMKPSFFSGPLSINIKGYILSYVVFNQFSPECLPKSFPLQSSLIRVNNFGRLVPEIRSKNTVLYIVRACNQTTFPKSEYIQKYAHYNRLKGYQMAINFDKKPPLIGPGPKCALLIYGSQTKECIDFAHLVLPDSNLEKPLWSFDLQKDMSLYYNNELMEQKPKEKELVAIKKGLQKHLKLIRTDDSD